MAAAPHPTAPGRGGGALPVAGRSAGDRHCEHIFFYGTLMRGFDLRRRTDIDRFLAYRGPGTVGGCLYDLGSYPALVSGTGAVRGEVYRVTASGPLLKRVDEVEGCRPGDRAASIYLRCKRTAVIEDGTAVAVWVYLYNRAVGSSPLIASGDYAAYRRAQRQLR